MSVVAINALKARFATGDRPTSKDFTDLIDTLLSGATGGGGGMTADQAVFVGPTANLVSKNAADARALLGVLSAGTKAAGASDDQILKNHGAQVSGQPAMYDGTGWLTYTKDAYLAALGVATKRVFFNSAVTPKTIGGTQTMDLALSFTLPAGATEWVFIELNGVTYLGSTTPNPADGVITFAYNCGGLTSGVPYGADGAGVALACAGLTSYPAYVPISTDYRGLVPAQVKTTTPLVLKATLGTVNDTAACNWLVSGVAYAK